MSDEMNKIKQLEEDLQDLQNERQFIEKKLKNIELEKEVIFNKEEEIRAEIRKIKDDGSNRFLGQYAVVVSKWGNAKHYIFITSVATEYNGCLAAFCGPNFCISDGLCGKKDINISCNHQSAHDHYCITIDNPDNVTIITKEEFLSAFEDFMKTSKELMNIALNAVPRKKTQTEWKYEDDIYEVKD